MICQWMKRLLDSDHLILYFFIFDIVLFLGFSYDELHWYLVNPANNPNWAVKQGLIIIGETFMEMCIAYSIPYMIYFTLINKERTNLNRLPYLIFITIVFVLIKLCILAFLVFFNYFVRYL